jgi:4'-phosphopantetheinyl transferase
MPIPLATNEARIWKVRLRANDARCNESFALLSADERRRADAFQVQEPRRRFVLARAALRTVLGRYLDLPPQSINFAANRNGKPRLGADQNVIYFNASHSQDLSLIAIAEHCEVGVDVEQLRYVRHARQIAERYFHPAESRSIAAAPPTDSDAAFLRCWTAKEALLKAVGTGITGSLAEFCIPRDRADAVSLEVPTMSPNGPATRCWLKRLDMGTRYLAAVAFVDSLPFVSICDFEW